MRELESPVNASIVQALSHVASMSDGPPLDPTLRVTLNFHPDRLVGGVPILKAMSADAIYYSQFVTRTSNGGLTAYPGGDRWQWESQMFAGAYDQAPAAIRPVYGALNFRHKPLGGAPRFGSAHLRLSASVLERTTFCYPDSVLQPSMFGVAASMGLIPIAEADEQDSLDDYIEAHVHGPVLLSGDVEALVLDPSYRGSDVETAASQLPCPVEWHPGVRLSIDEMRRHPDYRGSAFVDLGAHLAVDGWLTPRLVGDASRTGCYDEQALKRVWHYIARFGEPSA